MKLASLMGSHGLCERSPRGLAFQSTIKLEDEPS